MLVAVIPHSQIVVAQMVAAAPRLPAGFDDVDIAILEWIAAKVHRAGRDYLPM